MSGEAPEGWSLVRLGDIAKIVTGKTPSTKDPENWGGDIPFVTPSDLNGSVYVGKTERSLTTNGASKLSLLPSNSVLYTCIASIGKSGINTAPCVSNQQINACVFDTENDPLFHYYQLQRCTNALESLAGKTAVSIINKSKFSDFEVLCPRLPEQQRIAEILSSVDESIRATEAVITQAERVKQCMVDQFAIGKSHFEPESWVRISDIATINPRTSLVRGRVYPFIEMANLPIGSPEILKIEEREFSSGGAKFAVGDTLFARITPCTENGKLGFVTTLPTGGVAFGSTEFIVLHPKDAKVRPKLIYYYCFSNHVRQKAIQKMIGSTGRQRVPNHVFDEIQIPVYSLESQMAFEAAFGALDVQITTNRATVDQLQRLKRGLMDDLLTGKVRTVA